MKVDQQAAKDLKALCEYIFDTETEDFYSSIACEDYVGKGFMTKEELQEYLDGDEDTQTAIAHKVAMNPNCTNHIYAFALRLYNGNFAIISD